MGGFGAACLLKFFQKFRFGLHDIRAKLFCACQISPFDLKATNCAEAVVPAGPHSLPSREARGRVLRISPTAFAHPTRTSVPIASGRIIGSAIFNALDRDRPTSKKYAVHFRPVPPHLQRLRASTPYGGLFPDNSLH